jgi:DeoR family transcriptional regulator, fructose operon transcriptional repressor
MLSPQRQNLILGQLRLQRAASISELAKKLKVSMMTVRRDLDDLEQKGLLQRTHGGAILAETELPKDDPPFVVRDNVQQPAKQAIAKLATSLLNPGDQLILDSGSTVATMCNSLTAQVPLTVISYSVPVIHSLLALPHIRLICTGGFADPTINALTGPLAEKVLEGVRVDKAFIGATSLSLEEGFSNSSLHNLTLQRLVIKAAREVYLLVDHTKFSRPPFWLVEKLENLTAVLTDEQAPKEKLQQFKQAGVRVLVAPLTAE